MARLSPVLTVRFLCLCERVLESPFLSFSDARLSPLKLLQCTYPGILSLKNVDYFTFSLPLFSCGGFCLLSH